jgi:hypothetical protein
MSRPIRSNVPTAALRWSIDRAGIEFGLTPATLRKALARNSAVPDRDRLFSTAQIVAALFGSLHVEKLRTQRARAHKLELENAITTGSVLNKNSLMQRLAVIADAFKSRLMAASEIPRSVKEDLLHDLATWPLAVKAVAARQSRLPRGDNNGQEPDEDGSQSSDYERSGIKAKNLRKPAARAKRG